MLQVITKCRRMWFLSVLESVPRRNSLQVVISVSHVWPSFQCTSVGRFSLFQFPLL